MTILDDYQVAGDLARKLLDSKLRLGILAALEKGPMRLADLRREVNANAPNASSKAKDLERLGLVERIDGDFALTAYGRAVKERVEESLRFYATYEKFKEFWSTHHMESLPPEFIDSFDVLNDSVLIKASRENLIAPH
jgi:predicted transcriptional regulator